VHFSSQAFHCVLCTGPLRPSGEQLGAGLGELHIDPGFVPPKPTLGNRQIQPGTIFGWAAAFLEQEGAVDLLDMDAAVLDSLDSVRDLQQLARGLWRPR
jgi:hypothetical protein